MPKKKRKWVKELGEAMKPYVCAQRKLTAALKWANKFKTLEEAWAALEKFEWLTGIFMFLDPNCCRYDAADTCKATTFRGACWETGKVQCELARKLWPNIPAAIRKKMKKGKK
jgi:hypothetical protein